MYGGRVSVPLVVRRAMIGKSWGQRRVTFGKGRDSFFTHVPCPAKVGR